MKLVLNLFRPREKALSQQVMTLVFPVIMSNLSRRFMNLSDVAMVGRLGANALAATGTGFTLVWVMLSFGISLRTAIQTMASRRLGQKFMVSAALQCTMDRSWL